jgi:hypothetical protein
VWRFFSATTIGLPVAGRSSGISHGRRGPDTRDPASRKRLERRMALAHFKAAQ